MEQEEDPRTTEFRDVQPIAKRLLRLELQYQKAKRLFAVVIVFGIVGVVGGGIVAVAWIQALEGAVQRSQRVATQMQQALKDGPGNAWASAAIEVGTVKAARFILVDGNGVWRALLAIGPTRSGEGDNAQPSLTIYGTYRQPQVFLGLEERTHTIQTSPPEAPYVTATIEPLLEFYSPPGKDAWYQCCDSTGGFHYVQTGDRPSRRETFGLSYP